VIEIAFLLFIYKVVLEVVKGYLAAEQVLEINAPSIEKDIVGAFEVDFIFEKATWLRRISNSSFHSHYILPSTTNNQTRLVSRSLTLSLTVDKDLRYTFQGLRTARQRTCTGLGGTHSSKARAWISTVWCPICMFHYGLKSCSLATS